MDKHIWEGWTVGDFISDLQPIFNLIMSGNSHIPVFSKREDLKKWCMENQPGYKKYIPEVVNHFWKLTQTWEQEA